MDCIIKKVKTKYMNAIHDSIKYCVNLNINKLPQYFITNIKIEYNKMYLNKTVEQIYTEFHIIPSVNELINKKLIKKGKIGLLINLMNSPLKDIYQYYLQSDLYKYHRKCILKKEGENSAKLYDYIAENICKYFLYNKGNKKLNNNVNNNLYEKENMNKNINYKKDINNFESTFKPKISKYSQKKKAKFLTDAMNRNKYKKIDNRTINTEYKISTTLSTYDNGATKNNYKNRNVITQEKNEISERNEEYTFHPKLYKRNINKVFSQSKSLANERDNDKFFLRYNKARENYMYKKMKQISSKDECYDTMLTIFHNFTNKHQRNKKIHYSMNEYKNDAIYSMENKRTINVDQNIIQSLRNELLRIDLNDEK